MSVTNDQPAPPSLDEVKASVIFHHERVSDDLRHAREQRDEWNDTIRRLVVEEAEAARMVRALQPRKPNTAQPKGGKT